MHRVKSIIAIDPITLTTVSFKLPFSIPVKLLPIQTVLHGLKCDLPIAPFNWFLEFCPKCGNVSQSPIREVLFNEDILLFAEIDAYRLHQLTKFPYLCQCGLELIPRYHIN